MVDINSTKQKFISMRDKLKQDKNITYVYLLLIFMLVSLFFFYSFIYSDILTTTRHGIDAISLLKEGRITDFYSYLSTFDNNIYVVKGDIAFYDFPIYIIFAIWNFPLWILENALHIDVFNSFLCLVWMKSILMFFIVLSCIAIYKICKKIKFSTNNAFLTVLLFVSSNFFTSCIVITSQYDIICLTFILWGVYFYLKKNNILFILLFGISMPLKFFSAFVFVPLLLYKEKNILKIMTDLFLSAIPMLLFKIIIPSKDTRSFVIIKNVLLEHQICSVPIFIVIIGIFYIWCYANKNEMDEEILNKEVIYICLISYAIFVLIGRPSPYWLIYLVPFLEIAIVQNYKYIQISLLCEMVMTPILIFVQMLQVPWLFNSDTVGNLLISKIVNKQNMLIESVNIIDYINNFTSKVATIGFPTIISLGTAIFDACLLFILFINSPNFDNKGYKISTTYKINIWVIVARILIGWLICALSIWLYITAINMPRALFSNNVNNYEGCPIYTIYSGVKLEEEFYIQNEKQLESITFSTITWNQNYDENYYIMVSIYDNKSQECIFKNEIPLKLLGDNLAYKVDLNSLKVKNNSWYTVSFETNIEKEKEDIALVMSNSKETIGSGKAFVNGESEENDIGLIIRGK